MELTRRAFLAGALAAGCPSRSGARIQGAIVGGAFRRGHRLREGTREGPRAEERTGIAIAGGGIAGLSAAWALARAGASDFVVLELEDAPGGTARSGQGPVTPYPWAAHYVAAPGPGNPALLTLLDEVGALAGRDRDGQPRWAEEVLVRDPEERVFFRGEWYEGLYPRVGASPTDLDQLAAFEAEMRRWAAWRDDAGRPAFALPRAGSSADPVPRALDGGSMAAFLDAHGWTSPRLRWFAEYACRDDFGTTLAQTSAWAGIHYFASRLDPATGESAPLLTWPEGNGRVVAHLAQGAGPRLRTGCLVTAIEPSASGVDVLYEDAAGQSRVLHAGFVVCALPRFVAARVIAPWQKDPPPFLRETVYGAWSVANLTLHGRPASRGFERAWDSVIYDSPALGYVTATHQSGRDHGPTVLTHYTPCLDDDPAAGRRRLLDLPWEAFAAAVLDDLRPAHPDLDGLVERLDVYRWGHAMVRPRPGFLWSEALAASARPLGRVHFAHTDLSGLALFEEAQATGIAAAEAILRARGERLPAFPA